MLETFIFIFHGIFYFVWGRFVHEINIIFRLQKAHSVYVVKRGSI